MKNPFEKLAEQPRSPGAEKVFGTFEKLSEVVSTEGPCLLTIGMSQLEANEALLACIQQLQRERDAWRHAAMLGEANADGHGPALQNRAAIKAAIQEARRVRDQ